MEIEQKMQTQQKLTSNPQQNVAIAVKKLDIYGSNVRSQKECLSSIEKNLEHQGAMFNFFGGIYRKEPALVDSSVMLFKQDFGSQQLQNRQLQKDNDDLRIYLKKLEKNYKQMEEHLYELIEEKENLSQFEIDSDESMNS